MPKFFSFHNLSSKHLDEFRLGKTQKNAFFAFLATRWGWNQTKTLFLDSACLRIPSRSPTGLSSHSGREMVTGDVFEVTA